MVIKSPQLTNKKGTMKTKKEPLTENEFINLDDELYSMINKILYPNNENTINEDENLNNWYFDIRNKLCQKIHNKKIQLK